MDGWTKKEKIVYLGRGDDLRQGRVISSCHVVVKRGEDVVFERGEVT